MTNVAPAAMSLTNEEWHFILDSLNDRLENLTDLNTGDFGMQGDFDADIRMCEFIILAVQNRMPIY